MRTEIQKYLVRLEKPETLKLDKLFEQNLNNPNKDPIELFKEYGTHYLQEYIVGGRLDYSSVTNSNTFKSTQTVAVAAQASFSFLVGSVSVSSNN